MRYPIIIILLTFILGANGQSTTEPYSNLEIKGAVEVMLRPDDMYDVDAIENSDEVNYSIENGTLKIMSLKESRDAGNPVLVTANYKDITSVSLSDGARLTHEGVLDCDSLLLSATDGSEITLDLDCYALVVKASGKSAITLRGAIHSLHAELDSGAIFKGGSLETNVAYVQANAKAVATVTVLEEVEAIANSKGIIKVLGEPGKKEVFETGGGVVE